jgi:hypothetical protein
MVGTAVYALAVDAEHDRLYVGGQFLRVRGEAHRSLAVVTASGAELVPWTDRSERGSLCLEAHQQRAGCGWAILDAGYGVSRQRWNGRRRDRRGGRVESGGRIAPFSACKQPRAMPTWGERSRPSAGSRETGWPR